MHVWMHVGRTAWMKEDRHTYMNEHRGICGQWILSLTNLKSLIWLMVLRSNRFMTNLLLDALILFI